MSDRGMKKWAPYKSLVEQSESLIELKKSREKVEKPVLSIDQEEEINDYLTNYHGQTAIITFYRNERLCEITSPIVKIDINNRKLILQERKSVYFEELVSIKN